MSSLNQLVSHFFNCFVASNSNNSNNNNEVCGHDMIVMLAYCDPLLKISSKANIRA